ncbi:MAG: hypothetical protein A2X32_04045 [Elusimicrobia bacterium GWC2_64_44]|nr:MAG: hypothetical protein A2X32_04045 [Elusimicrobia bacterium GWC2_64_44]
MTPEQFTETLKTSCGGNLLSVVLYGSAAAGDGVEGKSDFNVMAVLKEAGLPELKTVAAASKDWLKAGNPPPLLFSLERLLASADTFPIELSDMKDFHRMLYGENPLPGIQVEPSHLRLALEREFKGKLILLRESYIACGGDRKSVERLIAGSLSQFLVLCRAALRLREGKVPASKLDCAERLKAHAQFDPAVFREAYDLRRGALKSGDTEALFGRYLAAIDALCAALDGWAAR